MSTTGDGPFDGEPVDADPTELPGGDLRIQATWREVPASAEAEAELGLWVRRLVTAIQSGSSIDLVPQGAASGQVNPVEPSGWAEEQLLPAAALRAALLTPDLKPDPRGLRLRGACITGRLNLDNANIPYSIQLDGCRLVEPASFRGARLAALDLRRSHCDSVNLDQAAIAGSLLMIGLVALNGVSLIAAHVQGELSVQGGRLRGDPDGVALNLTVTKIEGGAFLQGLKTFGMVAADRVKIENSLDLDRAVLLNPGRVALSLEGAHLDILVMREEVAIRGGINFTRLELGVLIVAEKPEKAFKPESMVATGWKLQDVSGALRTHREVTKEWLSSVPAGIEFVDQPWRWLADIHDRNGYHSNARWLRLKAARLTTRAAPLSAQLGRRPYGWLVGHGYNPGFAFGWLIGAVLVAILLASANESLFIPDTRTLVTDRADASERPTGATECSDLEGAYPCFNPVTHGLAAVLPPISGFQSAAWRVDNTPWLEFSFAGLRVFGWLLTVLILAAITGLLRKT